MSDDEANRIARAAQRVNLLPRGAKIALPTAAALGAGAALAIGAIPDSNGHVFTACMDTRTDNPTFGELRLIDPSRASTVGVNTAVSQCYSTSENTVTWNQQGPAGPVGAQGPAGPQGPAGGQGAQGSQGAPLLGGTDFAISGNSSKVYLKIEGIDGESKDTGHKGDVTIESFSFGSLPASQGSANGGGGAGKVKFADLTIKKVVDKASASLFQHAANGVHYKEATITVRKAGKGQQDFLKFDFKDVIISSYKIVGGGKVPEEQITLNFTKVLETFYKENKALGTLTIAPNTYSVAG